MLFTNDLRKRYLIDFIGICNWVGFRSCITFLFFIVECRKAAKDKASKLDKSWNKFVKSFEKASNESCYSVDMAASVEPHECTGDEEDGLEKGQ